MIIRKAKIEDSKLIAIYMMMAMENIFYNFIGENSFVKATQALECLISKKSNQYSYENCWVVESKTEIIAAANIYDGSKLQELRLPVVEEIKSRFNRDYRPEDETQAGEFYIDCFAVHQKYQGKGIGYNTLQFLINEYVHKKKGILGLLVDKENPYAKRLYLKLGFKEIGVKTLAGKKMEHLQKKEF